MSYFSLTPLSDAMKETGTVEWLIPGLLEEASLMAIAGAPGSGKSFLATDMAVSLATQTPWLGIPNFVPSRRCRVAYITPEGKRSTVARLAEQAEYRGASISDLDIAVTSGILTNASSSAYQELHDFAPDAVFIDTWARATPGVDENSASQVGRIINELDILREVTGACVVFVHHTAKEKDYMRGSSALLGAVDTQLLVTAEENVSHARVTKHKNSTAWNIPLDFYIGTSTVVESMGHPFPIL